MAMNIKNERVHELARQVARRTGTTQTSALEAALERYLAELGDDDVQAEREGKVARAHAVLRAIHDGMTDEDRAGMRRDLEALYDDGGLPD